jgi:hypothetical protein
MFRAVAQARKDGLSMEQAVERAAAELAREAEIVAKFEAARAPAEAPRFTPPTPRVRGL